MGIDFWNGFLIGLGGLFLCFVVYSRISYLSFIPLRLLIQELVGSIVSTFFRIIVLVPVLIFCLIVRTLIGFQNFSHIISLDFLFCLIFIYFLLIQYVCHHFSLKSCEFESSFLIRILKESGILRPIEERILNKTRILFTDSPILSSPMSYGGVGMRPCIIFPRKLFQRLVDLEMKELVVPILLLELGHIRRNDSFFFPAFYLLERFRLGRFISFWHSLWCDRFCYSDVLDRVETVQVLKALELVSESRPNQYRYFNQRKSWLALLDHRAVNQDEFAAIQKNLALKNRIIFFFIVTLLILCLSLFLDREIQSALVYHQKFKSR